MRSKCNLIFVINLFTLTMVFNSLANLVSAETSIKPTCNLYVRHNFRAKNVSEYRGGKIAKKKKQNSEDQCNVFAS